MGYIRDVKISNTTHLIEPTLYAETTGTASAYVAAISNFELAAGVQVTLKIHLDNAASATLNVNSTGAETIKYNGSTITANILAANKVYDFVYDGSYWNVVTDHLYDIDNNKNAIFPADIVIGNMVKLSANSSDECLDIIFV